MRKLASILLALALFAACALAEGADPLGAYPETITITTSRAMSETTVFDENDPLKRSYQENLWTNLFLERLNIDLDYEWVATDGDANVTKWAAAIATGNVPDFAYVDQKIYKMLLDAELIADCTDIYAAYASEEYKAMLPEASVEQLVFDGKLMGLPFPVKGYMSATMLFVRQDWLDKLGLEYPTDYESLVFVAKAFQEAKLGGEDTLGIMFSSNSSDGRLDGFMNMFGAYQKYWIEKDGGMVFSNIQPEMREALLELQTLYADGVINQDLAVTTADLAKEYIAGGKVGVFFSTSWTTTTSIQALYETDPEARVTSTCIFGADGEPIRFQTNTPVTGKVFVSVNCEHPEAVMKMLNLATDLTNDNENYKLYGVGDDGFMWYKYLPFGDMPKPVLTDMVNAYEMIDAYDKYLKGEIKNGEDYKLWTIVDNAGRFDRYVAGMEGTGTIWMPLTYGVDGTYSKLYVAFREGLHLENGYIGLPTMTQELLGDVVNDALETAMFEVIMGADISVYDAAVEAWLNNGGEAITEEINAALGL